MIAILVPEVFFGVVVIFEVSFYYVLCTEGNEYVGKHNCGCRFLLCSICEGGKLLDPSTTPLVNKNKCIYAERETYVIACSMYSFVCSKSAKAII